MSLSPSPQPVEINYRQKSRTLIIRFDNEVHFELSAEFLRVYSPSAEVRGHGRGQAVLQLGKESVAIDRIEPIGHYAVRLCFDDGHDTGLYSWEELYRLGSDKEALWDEYQRRLAAHHEAEAEGEGRKG